MKSAKRLPERTYTVHDNKKKWEKENSDSRIQNN